MSIRRVRVIVVTYNSARFVRRCLSAVLETQFDAPLDIVVVDNASSDATVEIINAEFPSVRLVRSDVNLGFAGGNNLAMNDLDAVDAVALVNADAFVSPGWLHPLIDALEADPTLGAAQPKIVLEPTFAEVLLDSEPFRPSDRDRGSHDDRWLGERLEGVVVDGTDEFARCRFPVGWSFPEDHARWTTGSAVLWVPVGEETTHIELTFSHGGRRTVEVADRFDVINNAGVELTKEWYARDRGLETIDCGQYDTPSEIWGWCGAAVLLRSSMLEQIGRFDDRYFCYYEDVELSWRGRRHGWRYRLVPQSVVRHMHGGAVGFQSGFHAHFDQRNRLVTMSRYAPLHVRCAVWGRYLRDLARTAWGELVAPRLRRRPAHSTFTVPRARSAIAAMRVLMSRRRR